MTGVRVSLRKSSKIFHKMPEGKHYGLLEWYPNAQKLSNRASKDSDESEPNSEDEESPQGKESVESSK